MSHCLVFLFEVFLFAPNLGYDPVIVKQRDVKQVKQVNVMIMNQSCLFLHPHCKMFSSLIKETCRSAMNGLFVSCCSSASDSVFTLNRRAVVVCLAPSAVCSELSVEAGGLHEATLLLQLTEPNNETQRRSYQGLGCLFTGSECREPKLSLNNEREHNITAAMKEKQEKHHDKTPVQREKSFISTKYQQLDLEKWKISYANVTF